MLVTDPANAQVYHPPGIGENILKFQVGLFLNIVPFSLRTLYYINKRVEVTHTTPNRRERKEFTRKVLKKKKGTVAMQDYYTLILDKTIDSKTVQSTSKNKLDGKKRKQIRRGQ